jgi:hypothetical protein
MRKEECLPGKHRKVVERATVFSRAVWHAVQDDYFSLWDEFNKTRFLSNCAAL